MWQLLHQRPEGCAAAHRERAGSQRLSHILMAARHQGERCLIRHDQVRDVERAEFGREHPKLSVTNCRCRNYPASVLSGTQLTVRHVCSIMACSGQYFPPDSVSCSCILCDRENCITCRHAFAPCAGDNEMDAARPAGPVQGLFLFFTLKA